MKSLIPSVLLISVLGLGACTGPMGLPGATGDTGTSGGATILVVPPTR
nr:hypothetical protein [Rhodoferax sp.]